MQRAVSAGAEGGLARKILTDIPAGLVVAAALIVHAGTYAALVLQGDARAGLGLGLWAALMGTAVTGLFAGIGTSMKPMAIGVDVPKLAVATALATTIAAQTKAAGLDGQATAAHILLALTLATVASGAVLLLLGLFRVGQSLRFIPYAVVAGFLGATGWFVMIGGLSLLTGKSFGALLTGGWLTRDDTVRVAVAAALALALAGLRVIVKSPFLLPALVLIFSAAIGFGLPYYGASGGWYLGGGHGFAIWNPVQATFSGKIDWRILLDLVPELTTIVIVCLISVIVKIASIESSRGVSADYDRELVWHGIGNMAAAPLGGVFKAAHLSASRLAVESGGRTWVSTFVCSAAILVLLVSGFDFIAYIPSPVLAGLLMFVGYGLLIDAFGGAIRHRAWFELGISLAILIVCVVQGYIVGVLAGLVASCLIFAVNYGRVGIVRRHLTRAQLSGAVSRAPEVSTFLRKQGTAIHIYWLSGYIFFGSSEQLFHTVRQVIEAPSENRVRFIVLDFASVSGADASARASLMKLRAFCARHDVELVISGLNARLTKGFRRTGLVDAGKRPVFGDFQRAVEWCEQQILDTGEPNTIEEADKRFFIWVAEQLGGDFGAARTLLGYLLRRTVPERTVLYEAGAPADGIDFVAKGVLDIAVRRPDGDPLVVRRMARETVVGEMGFFRSGSRSAMIAAHADSVVYTLKRGELTRLEAEQPGIALLLHKLIVRELAARLELANAEAAALR